MTTKKFDKYSECIPCNLVGYSVGLTVVGVAGYLFIAVAHDMQGCMHDESYIHTHMHT